MTELTVTKTHPICGLRQRQHQSWAKNNLPERKNLAHSSDRRGLQTAVLSIHSFINIPTALLSPHSMVLNPSRTPLHEGLHKKPREQHLGSLKEPLNKTIEDQGSSNTGPPGGTGISIWAKFSNGYPKWD